MKEKFQLLKKRNIYGQTLSYTKMTQALGSLLDFLHVLVNLRAFMEVTHFFLFIATCHTLPMSSSCPSLSLSHLDKMKILFEGLHTHRRVAVFVTGPLC